MKNGCVLVKLEPGKVSQTIEAIKKVKDVEIVFPAFGRYDVVAFVEAPDFDGVVSISVKINALDGVSSTETLPEAP